jgi:hypothetical protein
MSKPPKNRPTGQKYDDYGSDDNDELEYNPRPRPRAREQSEPPARGQEGSRAGGRQAQQPIPQRRQSSYRPRSVEARRDPYPILIGAVIGVAVAGAILIAYLLGTKTGTGGTASSGQPAASVPTTVVDTQTDTSSQPAPEDSVPRISLADFAKLYSTFSDRPYIVDVRTKDLFDQNHIQGAVSVPEEDLSKHLAELPKDKLIVTYCD